MGTTTVHRWNAIGFLLIMCLPSNDAIQNMLNPYHKDGLIPKKNRAVHDASRASRLPSTTSLAEELTFTQRLDHFNPDDMREWQQRYFVNLEFASNDSNVNFLRVGGEAAASLDDVRGQIAPVFYAPRFGAALYSLEHRFYGKSRPTPDQSLESLQYLTSQQALADLAVFISYINDQKGGEQKWVLFGGSYGGSLALWFRAQHPELVVGAVGSSAPVEAIVDFHEFLGVMEDKFHEYDIENYAHCTQVVQNAFTQVEQMLQTVEGRKNLTDKLRINPPIEEVVLNSNDIQFLYSNLQNPFMYAMQYEGIEITHMMCDNMVDPKNEDAFAALVAGLGYGGYDLYISYETNTLFYSHPEWDNGDADSRSWIWQTCNEFGFYMSTDGGSSIFGATNPNNVNLNMCHDLFGTTPDQLRLSVEATNQRYGGRKYYTGTNVVMTHGDYDPWRPLETLPSADPTAVSHLIDYGTHCSDLFPADGNSDVQAAQNVIIMNVGRWLNEPAKIAKQTIQDSTGSRPQATYSYIPSTITVEQTSYEPSPPRDYSLNRIRNPFTGRYSHGLLHPPPRDGTQDFVPVQKGWIQQPVNHFNPVDRRTFQQKFYVNTKFTKPNGPNFLMIGGESPDSETWVSSDTLTWMRVAKQFGATIYHLEHRFYGESKTGTNDLVLLTSSQMLYDVANFINTTKSWANATGPWITFGGSYSGSLSVWAREWFPELITGAVGSSSPVESKLDFLENLLVVEKSIREISPACANRTEEAFLELRTLASTPEGRQRISQLFRLYPAWSTSTLVAESDFHQVFSTLYGEFQGIVQYSQVNNDAGKNTIDQLCSYMTADKEAILALVDVHNWHSGSSSTLNNNATETLEELKKMVFAIEEDTYTPDQLADVLWSWQICNEFGQFPSTDNGRSMFGLLTPVNYFVRMCEVLFHIDVNKVTAGIENTLQQYGGRRNFKGSNVVLPQGSYDPWSALGIYNHPDKSVVSVLINGTTHCADMYSPRSGDRPALSATRQLITEAIKKWLA